MANYVLHDLKDTIVALATPPGAGAIGVIRLSGKEAIDIVNKCFPSKDLQQQPSHTIHFAAPPNVGGATMVARADLRTKLGRISELTSLVAPIRVGASRNWADRFRACCAAKPFLHRNASDVARS